MVQSTTSSTTVRDSVSIRVPHLIKADPFDASFTSVTSTSSYTDRFGDDDLGPMERGSLGTLGRTGSGIGFAQREGDSATTERRGQVLASAAALKLGKSQAVQEMSVNKLQFASLGLVGREAEVQVLTDRLKALMDPENTQRELIFIKGTSGCGKSSLARTLASRLESQKRGAFILGKFSQNQSGEPYSTILTACQDLASKIMDLSVHDIGKRSFHEIRETLRHQIVGSEIQLLVHAVPVLGELMLEPDEVGRSATTAGEELGNNKELLESAFRKFFRIVSSYFQPLILVLDDLQWSDQGTLDILKGLASDSGNSNLMLVGCYRSNEVDDDHILNQTIKSLHGDSKEINLHITEMECGNLTVNQTNQLIQKLTKMDDAEQTFPLADVCHARTMGNAFFLLIFVEMLHRDNLLVFDLMTFSWKWKIQEIRAQTGATRNVVDLMTQKMNQSSPQLIMLLKLACYLGSEFSAAILFLVWEKSPEVLRESDVRRSDTSAQFRALLEEAIQENFLERCNESLRWVHDKVQETAEGLDPDYITQRRKQQVGQTLLADLEPQDLEESLFVVVNLLNCGASHSHELAKLNLRAAKKANEFGAFGLQGIYAKKGIDYMEDDCWSVQKDLAVELYTMRAEAASCKGEFKVMNDFCDTVLEREECSMLDKIRCYDVQIHSLARTGQLKKAMNRGIEVLGMLGCKLPKGAAGQAIGGIKALLGFKSNLKKITPTKDQFSQMPQMSDPLQKEVVRLLSELAVHAYICNTPLVWIMCNIRMVHLTLQYGLSDQAQTAFPSCAVMIMHVLGDWKMGVHYAELSLLIKQGTKQAAAIVVSEGFVIGWMQPLQSRLKPIMEGYKVGMEVGDVEWAFANIAVFLEISLMSGKSLPDVVEDIQIYLPQFEALHASFDYAEIIRCVWQTCLNLMGESDCLCFLSGKAMREEEFLLKTGHANMTRDLYVVMKSFLCTYFGHHELGAKLALERGNNHCQEGSPGHPTVEIDPFLRGVSLYDMARKNKPRFGRCKYRLEANVARRMVKKWVAKGNPNVYHHLELLNAEHAALEGRKNAGDLYSSAARLASRSGFIQDAALASERHAEYLLEQNDSAAASFRMKEALERYNDWGASRKVEQLRKKYSHLLS